MATDYETLWQEVVSDNERLKAANKRLRADNRRLSLAVEDLQLDLEKASTIVDLAGISRHMKVARYTPQQWAQRDLLPPVDFPEIREPLWLASTIRDRFAEPTGRIWYDNPTEGDTEDRAEGDTEDGLSSVA